MKLAVIFSVLLVQTSASFFSEFKNSVSSVGSSLGKLISDTAVDLKDTFDCTVFAVRLAFSDTSTLSGYEKCQTNATPLSPPKPIQIIITPIVIPTSTDTSTTRKPLMKTEDNLNMTTSRNNTNEKVKIENKNDRKSDLFDKTLIIVNNKSTKLERELEAISKHVKEPNNITIIERDQKLPIEKSKKDIDKLLKVKGVSKNKTDRDIRNVSDTITTKLNKNNTDKIDLKNEIKIALAELEQNKRLLNVERQLEMWKEEEMKNLDDIKNLLKKQEQIRMINNRTIPTSSFASRTLTESIPSTLPMTSTTTVPATKVTKRRHARRRRPKLTKPPNTTRATTIKPKNDNDSLEIKDKSTSDQSLPLVDSSKTPSAIMAYNLKSENSSTS